ncbi:acyl-CoA N-acyltransferase [Biscogniauxia marginata]|nr:acyl-CoA N-acyltransferase [Biscogniauxia marginata]
MSSYVVRGCVAADGPSLAYNNISAFWTDPTYVLLWEDKTREYVIEQARKRYPKILLTDRDRRRHQVVVDLETGKIVGYSRWILPERFAGAWLDAQTPGISQQEEVEYDKSFKSADWNGRPGMDQIDVPVTAIKKRLTGFKEYIILDYLAVRPDYRGRGIGTMLVESGISQAERMGVNIFVIAYKAALGVYLRLGFKLLDQIIQDDSKYGGKGEYGAYFLEKEVKKVS